MISGILFDLDGTLIDCIRPMESAFVEVVEKLGSKITEEGRKNVAENLHEILLKRSSLISGASFLWRLGFFVGLPRYKRFLMMLLIYRKLKMLANTSPLFPGVEDLLNELSNRGLKLAVVTTRSEKEASIVLQKYSIDKYFNAIITRDDAQRGKPFPDPVLLALKLIGIRSEEAVMIGDMPTDIEAGRSAGTKTIGLTIGLFQKELIESKPDALAESITELPNLIYRL